MEPNGNRLGVTLFPLARRNWTTPSSSRSRLGLSSPQSSPFIRGQGAESIAPQSPSQIRAHTPARVGLDRDMDSLVPGGLDRPKAAINNRTKSGPDVF
jgi:hypothetical protein